MKDSTGKVYRLPMEFNGKAVYAKDVYNGILSFFILEKKTSLEKLASIKPFYSNWVHVSLPKRSEWEYLGTYNLNDDEKKRIPYFFRQDFSNFSDCYLIIPGELEPRPVKPEECVGLERAGVHDEWQRLREKLLSKLTGVKTPYDDLFRLKIPGIDKPTF